MVVLLVLLVAWLGLNAAVFTAAFALDRRGDARGTGARPAGSASAVRVLRIR